MLSQVHSQLVASGLLFYIKMQKVAKSRKLECTLDVLCHLYQTQMLLVASVFAALLLLILLFILLLFFSLVDFYYKVVFILFKCIFKFTCSNKLEQFCLINAQKPLCK